MAQQQQQQVMEAEWRLPQWMFAVWLWEQRRTSIQQLWPAQPFPACQTPADVRAGISPTLRQEAACRQNRLVITFFNPPADAQAPSISPKGQISPTKPSILLNDLFVCSIVDQMDELLLQSCYQTFGSSYSALTIDVFPSSGVQLAASRNHKSTLEHFKCHQSQKKKISNCFCFAGTQRAVDSEVKRNSRRGRRNKLQHVPYRDSVIIQSLFSQWQIWTALLLPWFKRILLAEGRFILSHEKKRCWSH